MAVLSLMEELETLDTPENIARCLACPMGTTDCAYHTIEDCKTAEKLGKRPRKYKKSIGWNYKYWRKAGDI